VKDNYRSFDYALIVNMALETIAVNSVDDRGMPFVEPEDGFRFVSWDRIRMHRDVAVFIFDNAYYLQEMSDGRIGKNFGLCRIGIDVEWSDEDHVDNRIAESCKKFYKFFPAWSRDFADTIAL